MMWDKWYPVYRRKYPNTRLDGDLARFHSTCLNIRERMRECVEKAENAERPNSSLSMRWEELAETVAASSPAWGSQGTPHPPTWPVVNNGDKYGSGRFGSSKGHKILGMGNIGGTSLDDGVIGSGWEGPNGTHYRKTLSEFVGGFRKIVKGRDDKDKEKEKELRETEKEKGREEKRERERLRKDVKKEASKEVGSELRFVAVADGSHVGYHYDDLSYYDHRRKF